MDRHRRGRLILLVVPFTKKRAIPPRLQRRCFGRIAFLFGVNRLHFAFPTKIRFGLVAHALCGGIEPTLIQAVPAIPRSGRLDRFRASLAALGAAEAFAFRGGFWASLLAGLEYVLRHWRLYTNFYQIPCRVLLGGATVQTKKDEWTEVKLPLDKFVATSFGRPMETPRSGHFQPYQPVHDAKNRGASAWRCRKAAHARPHCQHAARASENAVRNASGRNALSAPQPEMATWLGAQRAMAKVFHNAGSTFLNRYRFQQLEFGG
jgi:hypothetical protein